MSTQVQLRESSSSGALGAHQDNLADPLGGDHLSPARVASAGTAGSGSSLPHGDAIQASFGPHDVSGARAHTGASASAAADSLGASAFTMGNQVGFRTPNPSLHTAAHEAAHVVQQQAGVQLEGGMGESGDRYEQHADAVADRVVAGQSATELLDQVASPGTGTGSSSAVQLEEGDPPQKFASKKAMGRLGPAQAAISYTKQILSFGAGNQQDAILLTKANSAYRLSAMRDPKCWQLAPGLRGLASQYPEALTHAKALLAQGGNCGEHAAIAFDLLRRTAPDTVNYSSVKGLDHAFVVLGDTKADTDQDLVVSDPWPTSPKACIWEDHFAFTSKRQDLNVRSTSEPDKRDVAQALLAGLKLTERGKATIQGTLSDEETKKFADGDHVWNHANAHAEGKDFKYVEKED